MKKILFLLLIGINFVFLQTNNARAENWQEVSSGAELESLVINAPINGMLDIKVNSDITISNKIKMPEGLTLHIDMSGYALYVTSSSTNFKLSSGSHIIFENEKIIAKGTANKIKVPNPKGQSLAEVKGLYNGYYGLFVNEGEKIFKEVPTIIYKDVTQDLGAITDWTATGGQPFHNYGIQVEFQGNNLFNYPNSKQEFMEGAGFKVTNGTTKIIGNNTNGHAFVQQSIVGAVGNTSMGIDVAKGAELNINYNTTGSSVGVWSLGGGSSKAKDFHINNNGILNWISTGHKGKDFFDKKKDDIPINYHFGPSSKTNIMVSGLFNYDATKNHLNTKIDENADFTHGIAKDSDRNSNVIFIGKPKVGDTFEINSANKVHFITQKFTTGSILGDDRNNMPISLQSKSDERGYDIIGYSGGRVIIPQLNSTSPSEKQYFGARGVTGTFFASLSDIKEDFIGMRLPDFWDQDLYSISQELEFRKHVDMISFVEVPNFNSMHFDYSIYDDLNNKFLARNRKDGESTDMNFKIENTKDTDFSVQASISENELPDGITFGWKDGDEKPFDLGVVNNTIFTSNSRNIIRDPDGIFNINYPADQGLLFHSTKSIYEDGSYTAMINWTLVEGIS